MVFDVIQYGFWMSAIDLSLQISTLSTAEKEFTEFHCKESIIHVLALVKTAIVVNSMGSGTFSNKEQKWECWSVTEIPGPSHSK